jgi:uncharacterized membrane protein
MSQFTEDVTSDDDKLWGALSYAPFIGFFIALFILLTEEKKARPFLKFHAVQAITYFSAVTISMLIIIGLCVSPLLFIYQCYLCYKAYQGELTVIPMITDFIKNQKWI